MCQAFSIVRTPLYAHTYDHHHPIVSFTDVKIPVADRIGEEGRGHGLSPTPGSAASA